MMLPTQSENQDGNQVSASYKLMVCGFISPMDSQGIPFEVRRGMTIRSKEGLEVGKVAAVVENGDHKARHILLSRLPESRGYWLVGVDLIRGASEEAIQLAIPEAGIQSLPSWHSP